MSAKSTIIGFCGPMGAGKTTAADYLLGQGFFRVKMAAPLKNMLKAIGLTDQHIEGNLKEEPCDLLCGKTPRFAMQTLGTEWGRDMIGESIWTNLWAIQTKRLIDAGVNVVVDDVRFPNELLALKSIGGVLVEIQRPGHERSTSHQSEEMQVTPDVVIKNDGDLDKLYVSVHKFVKEYD